jgi:hypothetical protein
MRAVIEALVSATNLAILIREEGDSNQQRAANILLGKLERATNRVVALREDKINERVSGLPEGDAGQPAV